MNSAVVPATMTSRNLPPTLISEVPTASGATRRTALARNRACASSTVRSRGVLVIALIAGLGYMAWQRRNAGGAATGAPGRKDKFAPAAALSPTEMELLNYLVRAFPGRAVLFRVALSHLVSVRRADNRVALQQRLGEHSVDYVVCDRDGRAVATAAAPTGPAMPSLVWMRGWRCRRSQSWLSTLPRR